MEPGDRGKESGSDRARKRWAAALGRGVRRFLHTAKVVLTTEPGSPEAARADIAAAEDLARSAGELKGGVAKVAQLMAYLAGPEAAARAEARDALASLWDAVPPVDAAAIRAVVEEDLGAPPEELFDAWEDEPFAAASLGQVHAARSPDGTELAVKVQYPAVADALASDLASEATARRLAGAGLGHVLDAGALEALRAAVLREVDYHAELAAMERFRAAFAGEPRIAVPRGFADRSSKRVLAMERLRGRTLADVVEADDEVAIDGAGELIFRFAWEGPLRHRLLHGDPNPGNYLVLDGEPGAPVRVGFLDFGCAGALDAETADADRDMWRALLAGDAFDGAERFRMTARRIGLVPRSKAIDHEAYRGWEAEVRRPFARERFHWDPLYAESLIERTSRATWAGDLAMTAELVLLWRQRLGTAAVLGALGVTAPFRALLAGAID